MLSKLPEYLPEAKSSNAVYERLDSFFLRILFTIITSVVLLLSILNNKSHGFAKAMEFLPMQQNHK